MATWTQALPYFPVHELCCNGTGVVKLDVHFAVALPALRHEWDEPVTPSSVCRTPEHNARINGGKGGHPRSLHLTENPKWPTDGAMAIDWPWRNWPTEKKLRFARLAWRRGWSIGLHDGFCHLDRRADLKLPELPQAVFLYGEWGNHFSFADVRAA